MLSLSLVRLGRRTLVVAAIATAPTVALAQTTANLTVTASVVAGCTVSAGTLAFGDYNPAAGGTVDGAGTFDVTCTQGTLATVAMGPGQYASGGARRMLGGSSYLTYELYKDAGRSQIWGDAGGTTLALAAAPSRAARTLTVYGRIPAAQDVVAGSYGDTVVISVTF